MDVQETTATPGWYADPTGAPQLRWWSGAGWTERTAAHPVVAEPVRADREAAPAPVVAEAVRTEHDATPASVPPSTVNWWEPRSPGADTADSTSPAAGAEPGTTAAAWLPPVTAASWGTGWAWLLAATPVVYLVAGIVVFSIATALSPTPTVRFGFGGALLALVITSASRDRSVLRDRGLRRLPSMWWLLLGPLFYLAARATRISKEGGPGDTGPFWTYLAAGILCFGVIPGVLLSNAGYLGGVASPVPGASEVSAVLQQELLAAGYNVTVECPTGGDYSAGASFTCSVDDPNAAISEIDAAASDDGGGMMSYIISAAR